jgi:uncharacterized protein
MSRWESKLKTARRVQQDDWDVVDKVKWVARLLEQIEASVKPVVLVAHSCGVPTVVHAASRIADGKVIAAFLVASPSETATAGLPDMDRAFVPFPREPLRFPSLLVASRTDEHCTYDQAAELGLAWGSTMVDAGDVGQLNTASGHGPWPEGVMRLGLFLQQLGPLKTA